MSNSGGILRAPYAPRQNFVEKDDLTEERLRLAQEAVDAATSAAYSPSKNYAQNIEDAANQHSRVEVPYTADTDPDRSASNDLADETVADSYMTKVPYLPGATMGRPGEVVYGQSYLPFGGEEGEERWNRVVKATDDAGTAVQEEGRLQAERSGQLADFYKRDQVRQSQEAAILSQRRQENNAVLNAKMDNMLKTTQKWSNELADTGRYWKNPFNVLSAVITSFMTLGTHDPTIAHNIISGAVKADWEQRKHAADMELGELRSNIGQFRQIAGDKELGDALAYADANRIAALEIQRIGQTFEGPLAKAQAAKQAALFEQKSQLALGEIWSKMMYVQPQIVDPRIEKRMSGTGGMPGGYKAYGKSQQTPQAQSAGPQSAGYGAGPSTSDISKAVGRLGGYDKAGAAAADRRFPGSSTVKRMYDQQLLEDAIVAAGGPGKGPNVINEKMRELNNAELENGRKVVERLENIPQHYKFWQKFVGDINQIQSGLTRAGVDADEHFLGRGQDITGPAIDRAINTLKIKYGNSASPEAAKARAEIVALSNFRQALSQGIAEHYKEISGGAITEAELPRLKAIIAGDDSWAQIKNFANMKGEGVAAQLRGKLQLQKPLTKYRVMIDLGLDPHFLEVGGRSGRAK